MAVPHQELHAGAVFAGKEEGLAVVGRMTRRQSGKSGQCGDTGAHVSWRASRRSAGAAVPRAFFLPSGLSLLYLKEESAEWRSSPRPAMRVHRILTELEAILTPEPVTFSYRHASLMGPLPARIDRLTLKKQIVCFHNTIHPLRIHHRQIIPL